MKLLLYLSLLVPFLQSYPFMKTIIVSPPSFLARKSVYPGNQNPQYISRFAGYPDCFWYFIILGMA